MLGKERKEITKRTRGLFHHLKVATLTILSFWKDTDLLSFWKKKIVTTRAMTTFSEQGARAARSEGKQNLGILAYYLLA